MLASLLAALLIGFVFAIAASLIGAGMVTILLLYWASGIAAFVSFTTLILVRSRNLQFAQNISRYS